MCKKYLNIYFFTSKIYLFVIFMFIFEFLIFLLCLWGPFKLFGPQPKIILILVGVLKRQGDPRLSV